MISIPIDYHEPVKTEFVCHIDESNELIDQYKKIICPLDSAIAILYRELDYLDDEKIQLIMQNIIMAKKDLIYTLGFENIKLSDVILCLKDVHPKDEDDDLGW